MTFTDLPPKMKPLILLSQSFYFNMIDFIIENLGTSLTLFRYNPSKQCLQQRLMYDEKCDTTLKFQVKTLSLRNFPSR
jgi:hypothetical protein